MNAELDLIGVKRMPRLIDAGALICKALTESCFDSRTEDVFLDLVDAQPTIEAEPVWHGRWVDRYGNKYDNHLYECSECKGIARYRFTVDELGKEIAEQSLDDYCPHCGAKMDGGACCGAA